LCDSTSSVSNMTTSNALRILDRGSFTIPVLSLARKARKARNARKVGVAVAVGFGL
jgi:hypothetical protein